MIQYTVKPDRVGQNEELVQAVLANLRDVQPEGLSYAVFKLSDGVTFIHLIDHPPRSGPLRGRELEALREFHSGLRERCEDSPVRTEVSVIGTFGQLGQV